MDHQNTEAGTKFSLMNERIKKRYPNAKFDMFLTESSLDRIINFNKYIIVTWLGDVCCGASTVGHEKPKVYIVHGKCPDYITLDDVIETLVNNGFETPCDFSCFNDVTPNINLLDISEPVYHFSMNMTHKG